MQQFELNIFAIIILISLLIVIYLTNDTMSLKIRLFRFMIFMTIFMNFFEILSWVFDSKPGTWNEFFNFTFNAHFTALGTVVAGLWATYIDYLVFKDYKRLRKKWYYFLPAIIMVVLSIVNIFYPILFELQAGNVYTRLPLIWIQAPLTIGMYIYVFYLVLRQADALNRKVLLGVLIFFILPIIAMILQLLYCGLMLVWPATALAVLITYLIFETTSNARDYLTGIFTRERAEEQIQRLLVRKKNFSVIMLDVNDFKNINDDFGHHFGDKVLIFVANILKEVFYQRGLVSRHGGDEFLIVTEITDPVVIHRAREEMNNLIMETAQEEMKSVTLSFGVSTSYYPETKTTEQMIIEADNRMYKDKENMKKQLIKD